MSCCRHSVAYVPADIILDQNCAFPIPIPAPEPNRERALIFFQDVMSANGYNSFSGRECGLVRPTVKSALLAQTWSTPFCSNSTVDWSNPAVPASVDLDALTGLWVFTSYKFQSDEGVAQLSFSAGGLINHTSPASVDTTVVTSVPATVGNVTGMTANALVGATLGPSHAISCVFTVGLLGMIVEWAI